MPCWTHSDAFCILFYLFFQEKVYSGILFVLKNGKKVYFVETSQTRRASYPIVYRMPIAKNDVSAYSNHKALTESAFPDSQERDGGW